MDDETLRDAIIGHPAESADALLALAIEVPTGEGQPKRILTAEAITGAAAMSGVDRGDQWVISLRAARRVSAFVTALRARGVTFDEAAVADPDGSIDFDALQAFLPKAKTFRCRVFVDGKVKGSGVLVGPSLVMTSWHVIAVKTPEEDQVPAPRLSVRLADGSLQNAMVPARWESRCGRDEFRAIAPRRDDEVLDRHDVAVLAMERPAAIHLGFVALPDPAPAPRSRSRVVLIHYPGGKDTGIDFGLTSKVRNVTARWRHDVATKGGSSGGACFDRELRLIGVHQGQLDDGARFVPVDRFLAKVQEEVSKDVAPLALWSLDGTVDGPLVIGRDLLFEAIAAAGVPVTQIRGLRVKRQRIEAGSAGLAFTHEVVANLLARKGPAHVLARVTTDEIVADLVGEIERRVGDIGIVVPVAEEAAGVAPGQAPPETTAKDRAANLAAAIEGVAAAEDKTVWIFFDNPSVVLPEAARLAFEGFVGAALNQPHIRLIIAGFETLPLPGLEFAGPKAPTSQGAGLVVEFLGGFARGDVLNLLTRASLDLTGGTDPPRLAAAADAALLGLPQINGIYEESQLETVAVRLRVDLGRLRDAAGGGG